MNSDFSTKPIAGVFLLRIFILFVAVVAFAPSAECVPVSAEIHAGNSLDFVGKYDPDGTIEERYGQLIGQKILWEDYFKFISVKENRANSSGLFEPSGLFEQDLVGKLKLLNDIGLAFSYAKNPQCYPNDIEKMMKLYKYSTLENLGYGTLSEYIKKYCFGKVVPADWQKIYDEIVAFEEKSKSEENIISLSKIKQS